MREMIAIDDRLDVFSRFGLDRSHGFVCGIERGATRLPAGFEAWEGLAARLPEELTLGLLRSSVQRLPLLDASALFKEPPQCERAYTLLSFIAHAYIRGRRDEKPLKILPASIAVPWICVAEAIGTLPVMTYCGSVLLNFRLLDAAKPLGLENAWTIATATGSVDESWFYLVSLAIEARSGPIIQLFLEIQECLSAGDYSAMSGRLLALGGEIEGMTGILQRMYEENIPTVFYSRVRRYLAGWREDAELPDGLLYGKASGDGSTDRWHKFVGASAAQSPLIQALDVFFGIRHAEHSKTAQAFSSSAYLIEMRQYMKREHCGFLGWLEKNTRVAEAVQAEGVPKEVRDAFNACLAGLRVFRDKHLQIVSVYITLQAQQSGTDCPVLGTGACNPLPFLREVRSCMDAARVRPQPD